MTLWDYANWMTKNSAEPVVISGAKFTNNSVILTNATYAKLPIPKYVSFSLSLRCKKTYIILKIYFFQTDDSFMCYGSRHSRNYNFFDDG